MESDLLRLIQGVRDFADVGTHPSITARVPLEKWDAALAPVVGWRRGRYAFCGDSVQMEAVADVDGVHVTLYAFRPATGDELAFVAANDTGEPIPAEVAA